MGSDSYAEQAGSNQAGVGLKQLLSMARPQRSILIVVFVFGILSTATSLAQPVVVGAVIDAVSSNESVRSLVAVFSLLFLADAIFLGFRGYLLGKAGSDIILGMRGSLISRLLRLRTGVKDQSSTGDLLSRVSADTSLMRGVLTTGLVEASLSVLTLLGALVLMLFIDWVMLVAVLIALLLPTAAMIFVMPRLRAANKQAQEDVGEMTAALEQSLNAVRTVKASKAEEREAERIYQQALSARHAGVRVAKIDTFLDTVVNVLLQASFVILLGLGGIRLAAGAIDIAGLVSFLLYMLFLVGPALQLSGFVSTLQTGLAAFERVNEALSLPTEIDTSIRGNQSKVYTRNEGQANPSVGSEIVSFDSVTFGYDEERYVLQDISFTIQEHTKTAIVGPSGAGKSTILELLERFYEPEDGTIYFEGTDICSLPRESLRSSIGYVEQDCPILSGSIKSNLLYAKPEASDAEIDSLLDLAGLRDLVERLPSGIDSTVGDNGVLLSGGERQRIAIARALLAKPKLILLDEATSQLDTHNEKLLGKTIDSIKNECTVIVVAHRLSTVHDAEEIIVLREGGVSNIGTHDHLLREDHTYKELVTKQQAFK